MKAFFSFLFLSVTAFPHLQLHAQPLKVDVAAPNAILINADNGRILYQKKAFELCQPASTIKIATALYVVDRYGHRLDEVAKASRDALASLAPSVKRAGNHPAYRQESDGTHINLIVGEQMPIRTLLEGMMLRSGNDAANVIAEHLAPSIPHFVDELNNYLKEIGIENTVIKNPHGLPDKAQLTTPYDLAMIAKKAIEHDVIVEMTNKNSFQRPQTNKSAATTLPQSNRLLRKGEFYYPKAFGLKTGTTAVAKNNLIAAAKDGERTLVAVLLGCPESKQRFRDAITLFEAAFAEKKETRKLFSAEHERFRTQIPYAKFPLEAAMKRDVTLSYYPSEEPECKAYVNWKIPSLPIKEGALVGKVEILAEDGALLCQEDLFAVRTIELSRADLFMIIVKQHLWKILIGLSSIAITLFLLFKKKK